MLALLLNAGVAIIGLYITAESIAQLDSMHRARLCALARFVLAGLSGLWLVHVGLVGNARGITLVLAMTVALFIWPATWSRVDFVLERLRTHWLL